MITRFKSLQRAVALLLLALMPASAFASSHMDAPMSALVGLPFVLSSRKLSGIHYSLQMIAGALSLAFGIWYAYETGIASGLVKSLATV